MKKKKYINVFIVAALVAFLTVCVALIFCGNTYSAVAEETSAEASQDSVEEPTQSETSAPEETPDAGEKEGILPETQASKWFSETLLPLIMQYGAAALGVLSAGFVLLGKIARTVKELKGAKDDLANSNKQNESSRKRIEEFENSMREKYEEQERKLQEANAAHEREIGDKIRQIEQRVANDVHDTKKAVDKLLAVERSAYLDSPALVSDGTARKIAEVLDETVET